ncbi:hypothetical protein L6452_09176 [Arctium lappa]|uniref:Uncharacterized protein n=1 Tax=Arctium lappa TaxID=4217 RepID=A0ACB9DJL1_ARCLA|nr:hypothetical protein L6452_09176 [Arctium lappa]
MNGFDALTTDAELIQFLDAMKYAWEPKPRTTIPNKKLTLVNKALMPFHLNYIFSHFIQCMSGKSGSLDQASKPLPNEVSISELRSRLSLVTSSTSASMQKVPSSPIPAATPSKRPSTGSLGPSKKAKVTKEKATSRYIPKDVSLQTSLDAFVGLSSTSSATTTSTVPAISVAVTTTVTQPTISVQQPEVTTPIPTSSIPISSPSISLISNPPTISTPQFGPIGPEHQSFEESLQFYKMFDNSGIPITLNTSPNSPYKPVSQKLTYISGPTLATVDTNVNNLSAKVESMTASLNTTTNAVQSAGEALKTLTATCASKADVSHIATLQEAIDKVREDSQQQFAALTTKVHACEVLLHQILTHLKAPAPTSTPSFTENDRTSLNIAVEFIHQATSDLPAFEGRLDCLEAEVQLLAAAKASYPSKDLSLNDNDKEGEKAAEKNTEFEVAAEVQQKETPSQEEDDVNEDLDLEDQEDDSHQDDDDDDEDQSLWCSSAVTSSAIASKEVIKAGGSQETPSGTPSQSKGATSEGTLKMISLPEENPSQFSPLLKGKELQIIPAAEADDQIIPISVREIDEEDEEEEESLQHYGRPSRSSHWSEEERNKTTDMISHLESQRRKVPSQSSDLEFLTEVEIQESVRNKKLIADCQRDASLALKIQSSQVKDKKLKSKPVEVQAALLKEIEEERSKDKAVSDNSIDWCKHKIDYRSDPLKIVEVAISGRKKKDKLSVTMEITREDGSCKAMFISKLEDLGYMEWLEFKGALKKSKSTYRGYVERVNDALINRVAAILKVPSTLPPKEALFGPPPDLSVLDLSLPPGGPYAAGQVLKEPFGIFFRDDEEQLRFQRVSEIPICPLALLKDLMCLWCTLSPVADPIIANICKESLEQRQKGEEIPEYLINPPKPSLDS